MRLIKEEKEREEGKLRMKLSDEKKRRGCGNISDFKLPIPPTKLRVRQPAHAVSEEYIEKYKTAVQLMKDLPDSDPRSFKNQANVHCAYCEGSYDQLLAQDKKFEFQVHHSWLFFPFHRWYLYFYERILGKLIDDPTFALPFWNWDSPLGMTMPRIYTDDPNSPLYDRLRSTSHQPPTLLDFNYNKNSPQYSEGRSVIRSNLTYMYRQMVSNAKNPEMFFGCPFRAGETPETGPGSIENVPHDIVHLWSGDDTQCHNEDLGSFHSAGRDPMFFAHHSNVDRMWYLWKNKLGGKYNRDFDDSDWLNTEFYFYDEKAELVRVKIRDCLDNEKQLGYTYKEVDLPWLYSKPIPLSKRAMKSLNFDDPKFLKAADGIKYVLDRSPIKVLVPLPKKKNRLLRSLDEKESVEEVLEIEGITFDTNQHVKFNVYVNDEDVDNPCYSEFAGSFVNVPHYSNSKSVKKTCLRLGLSDLLDAMEVEDDEYVIVTLKPFHINNRVTIDSINIELVHNSHYKPSRPPIPGKVEELS
ncbi:hypothetical protein UlMin_018479 [Ulmus minor]